MRNTKRILIFMLCAIMLVSSGSCGLRTVEESDVSNPSDASEVSLPPVPIPETPVVLLMNMASYDTGKQIDDELGNARIYKEEECLGTTQTIDAFGIELTGEYSSTKEFVNTNTALRIYENYQGENYTFYFQIDENNGKLVSLTVRPISKPKEYNLLKDEMPLEEIIQRCHDFLVEQTGVEGWVEHEAFRDVPDEYGGTFQFRKYVNNVCVSWATFYNVDNCGNIWEFDFTGVWDYEGIQIPDWPESFFEQIARQKLLQCFADFDNVADVKDVVVVDGPELCYIRAQESWALEFYINYTVVKDDGTEKTYYTKMGVLFDS